MIYYHVSIGCDDTIKTFTPRIPESVGGSEDISIPRICFAPTIEQCLCAIKDSEELLADCDYEITVYSIDTNTLKQNFIDNNQVQQYVYDAFYTGEVWITEPLTLHGTHYSITYLDTSPVVFIDENKRGNLSFDLIQLVEQGRIDAEIISRFSEVSVYTFVNKVIDEEFSHLGITPMDLPTVKHIGYSYTYTITLEEKD